MKARATVLVGLLMMGGSSLAGAQAKVADLAWMAGCWERVSAGSVTEEQWLRPAGGLMLGMGRTLRGDSVVDYETMRIEDRGGAVMFTASPAGQPTAEFLATTTSGGSVGFSNPTHDFPTSVGYRSGMPDSLHAWIEGPGGGSTRRIEFHYRRAACPP